MSILSRVLGGEPEPEKPDPFKPPEFKPLPESKPKAPPNLQFLCEKYNWKTVDGKYEVGVENGRLIYAKADKDLKYLLGQSVVATGFWRNSKMPIRGVLRQGTNYKWSIGGKAVDPTSVRRGY